MHTFFRRIAGLIAFSLGGAACSGLGTVTITGNGQNKIEERQVGAFDAITVSDSLRAMVTVAANQPQSVQVSGDGNLVSLVRATVSGTELTLDMPPNTSFTTKLPLVVTVSTQALHALKADSSAVAIASSVSGDDVTVESSNSSEVKVTSITAAKSLTIASDSSATLEATSITAGGSVSLKTDRSGKLMTTGINATGSITVTADNNATATVSGTTPMLTAQVDRSANLQAQDLRAASVVITTSSAASAQVCATTSLNATLTTNSQVGYHCNPANVIQNVDQTSMLTKQ
ncbi:MAG TPA: DUF2807 domain-containing protein [Kofleriaceae bacterium]|nr:DUF2807 domain-containing protein [Kofleriaceae bacterium]